MADGALPGGWKGLAGMAEAARKGLNAWGDVRFTADEYRELDDERGLVLEHRSGRSKTSGLELGQLEAQGAHLFYIRDCKAIKLVAWWDRDRALADLGVALDKGAAPA